MFLSQFFGINIRLRNSYTAKHIGASHSTLAIALESQVIED
jgi:hypothetical protein